MTWQLNITCCHALTIEYYLFPWLDCWLLLVHMPWLLNIICPKDLTFLYYLSKQLDCPVWLTQTGSYLFVFTQMTLIDGSVLAKPAHSTSGLLGYQKECKKKNSILESIWTRGCWCSIFHIRVIRFVCIWISFKIRFGHALICFNFRVCQFHAFEPAS